MSRILSVEKLFIGSLLLTIACLRINAEDKTKASRSDTQTTGVGENLVVSLINNIFNNDFFKSGIESSVRSVFSKPITSAVYALSVLAGVVAMLAFYESPVSPMPVPPLPDPPVGRFPPEHPIWPPPQKDALPMNDKKRIGIEQYYGLQNYPGYANALNAQTSHSQKVVFPSVNSNQKYSEVDPTSYAGAYQQLMNVLENRNSKNSVKQNRISNNLVVEPLSSGSQVYSTYSIDSDPKLVNDSVKLQSLYSEIIPTDRHDTVDMINKLYNQNNYNKQMDKIKDYTNIKKVSNSEIKDKTVNYTITASEPIPNRKTRP